MKQDDPDGPGTLIWEKGQNVIVEPFSTAEAQFENKGQLNFGRLSPKFILIISKLNQRFRCCLNVFFLN